MTKSEGFLQKKSASNSLGKAGNKGTGNAEGKGVETLGYGTSFCIDLSITCSTGLQLKWKWVYIKAKLQVNSIKTNEICDYASVSDMYLSHTWFCWKLISQKLLCEHFVGIKVLCVSQLRIASPRSIWDSCLGVKMPTTNLITLSDSTLWGDLWSPAPDLNSPAQQGRWICCKLLSWGFFFY